MRPVIISIAAISSTIAYAASATQEALLHAKGVWVADLKQCRKDSNSVSGPGFEITAKSIDNLYSEYCRIERITDPSDRHRDEPWYAYTICKIDSGDRGNKRVFRIDKPDRSKPNELSIQSFNNLSARNEVIDSHQLLKRCP